MTAPRFEVGQLYPTRGGDTGHVVFDRGPGFRRPLVVVYTTGLKACYDLTREGRFTDIEHPLDLMPPAKVQYIPVVPRVGFSTAERARRCIGGDAGCVVAVTYRGGKPVAAEIVEPEGES